MQENTSESQQEREARLENECRHWMHALKGHRYHTVDSQREDFKEEVRALQEKCQRIEETIVRLTERLEHITRRSKFAVKQAVLTAQGLFGDVYDDDSGNLDALSSVEKMSQLVEQLASHVNARNVEIERLKNELEVRIGIIVYK
jgi:hypothetical protein